MRLWSLHPQYLDVRGLTACWREALLAQKVLTGQTMGYRNHPQLARFKQSPDPPAALAAYLAAVWAEAARRSYRFDGGKIGPQRAAGRIPVTEGQLRYEWAHLKAKLKARDPRWLEQIGEIALPEPHPVFVVVPGEIESWEIRKAGGG